MKMSLKFPPVISSVPANSLTTFIATAEAVSIDFKYVGPERKRLIFVLVFRQSFFAQSPIIPNDTHPYQN